MTFIPFLVRLCWMNPYTLRCSARAPVKMHWRCKQSPKRKLTTAMPCKCWNFGYFCFFWQWVGQVFDHFFLLFWWSLEGPFLFYWTQSVSTNMNDSWMILRLWICHRSHYKPLWLLLMTNFVVNLIHVGVGLQWHLVLLLPQFDLTCYWALWWRGFDN